MISLFFLSLLQEFNSSWFDKSKKFKGILLIHLLLFTSVVEAISISTIAYHEFKHVVKSLNFQGDGRSWRQSYSSVMNFHKVMMDCQAVVMHEYKCICCLAAAKPAAALSEKCNSLHPRATNCYFVLIIKTYVSAALRLP